MTDATLLYCPKCKAEEGAPHDRHCIAVYREPTPMTPHPRDFKEYLDYMAAARAWDFQHQPITASRLVEVLEQGGYKAMAATIRQAFEK